MRFDFDLHIHTYHSPCGSEEMTPADIVRVAASRGMRRIAITDHLYTFTDHRIFDSIRAEVAKIESDGLPEVYYGCEVEVMAPGKVAGDASLTEQLDFIMAGTTHFQNVGITELPPVNDERIIGLYYLQMFEYAVSLPWINVIAHPFYVVPKVCSVRVLDYIPMDRLVRALETARANSIAMEISRRALGQIDFSMSFYRLCKDMGLKFTVGSDAHSLSMVGNLEDVEPIISRLGLCEEDFWLPRSKAREGNLARRATS